MEMTIRGSHGRFTTLGVRLETAQKIKAAAGDRPVYQFLDELIDNATDNSGSGTASSSRLQRALDRVRQSFTKEPAIEIDTFSLIQKFLVLASAGHWDAGFGDDVVRMSPAARQAWRTLIAESRSKMAELSRRLDDAEAQLSLPGIQREVEA